MDAPASGLLLPAWDAPATVRACVTTALWPGVSLPPFAPGNLGDGCGDAPAAVAANRAALVGEAALPQAPHWLRQVHGTAVYVADHARPAATPPAADASYTRAPGAVLAVLSADCLPLLLCSADGREVAAVHAGWRGLAAGVIEAALAHFHSPPAAVCAWLGPAIGAASYEVGGEVRAAFLAHDADAATAFVPTRPGHWTCDLYALARRRLAARGVGRVQGGAFDTRRDPRFCSHRRGAPVGRCASLVWLAPG